MIPDQVQRVSDLARSETSRAVDGQPVTTTGKTIGKTAASLSDGQLQRIANSPEPVSGVPGTRTEAAWNGRAVKQEAKDEQARRRAASRVSALAPIPPTSDSYGVQRSRMDRPAVEGE